MPNYTYMQLELNLLSKYRTQLMGLAMLWVMLYHSKIIFTSKIFEFISSIGYGGVDIFILLSGMGVYFSLNKETNIKEFYKRRVSRVLPYYLPIVLLYSIYLCYYYNISVSLIFYNLTTLSFWLNPLNTVGFYGFDWYIPSLLALYLLSPFYMKIFNKKPIITTIVSLSLVIGISILMINSHWKYLLIFTWRIPNYLIGILVGFFISKQIKLNIKTLIILTLILFIGIIGLYIVITELPDNIKWQYGLWWIPFIFITFPLITILSLLLSLLKNYQYPILSTIGNYTLVIYLLHERIIRVFENLQLNLSIIELNLIVLIITFSLGYIYQNQIKKIITRIL